MDGLGVLPAMRGRKRRLSTQPRLEIANNQSNESMRSALIQKMSWTRESRYARLAS